MHAKGEKMQREKGKKKYSTETKQERIDSHNWQVY